MSCSKCGNNLPIVNKKYKLCTKCNWERLHPEGTFYNRLKKLSQVSKKEQVNKDKLKEVYAEMDSGNIVCSGCGNKNMLSHGHLIRRSKRKDLELDPKNIVYDCLQREDGSEGCHTRFESMDWHKMNTLKDFDKRLAYIKSKDIQLYNKIISKKPENG